MRLHILKRTLTLCQVRGTPASGKTSLAKLVAQYIRQQEPSMHVIWIQGWPHDEIQAEGCWECYFQNKKGWVKTEKTVFIFDEAQLSYWDGDLSLNPSTSIKAVAPLHLRVIAVQPRASP
jgi:hypothetical protein